MYTLMHRTQCMHRVHCITLHTLYNRYASGMHCIQCTHCMIVSIAFSAKQLQKRTHATRFGQANSKLYFVSFPPFETNEHHSEGKTIKAYVDEGDREQ